MQRKNTRTFYFYHLIFLFFPALFLLTISPTNGWSDETPPPQQTQSAAEKVVPTQDTALQQKLDILQKAASQSQDEIDQLVKKVNDLTNENSRLQKENTLTALHNLFVMSITSRIYNDLANPQETAAKKPFKFYQGDDWRVQREAYISHLQSLKVLGAATIDEGDGPNSDISTDDSAGDYILNDIYSRSFEIFRTNNNTPNKIIVAEPGLADLDRDTLYLLADPEIDTVLLDGCLTWKKTSVQKEETTWTATDIDGEKRHVEVNAGVEVKVLPKCIDYFLQADIQTLQRLTPQALTMPPAPHFGGIGIGVETRPQGVLIRAIIHGSPAEEAGLHKGDYIIRIDGKDTKDMSMLYAISLMRGEVGSSLSLTYISFDDPLKRPKEVNVLRKDITVSQP